MTATVSSSAWRELSPRIVAVAILGLSILVIGLGDAQADILNALHSHSAKEAQSEVAFVLTGWVKVADVDALAQCLPTKERTLPLKGDLTRAFSGVRWTPKALNALDHCGTKDCRFNFPMQVRREIEKAQGRDAKKRAYFNAVRRLAWSVDKKKKRDRIKQYQVRSELCANHDLFYWLLDGKLKRWDRVVWRKHYGNNKRMRPTLEVVQVSRWTKGPHRCIGTTLLFADHYLNDGVDILQLTPLDGGRVAFRLYTRDRFDFFGSWWARRFRGTIRKQIRDQKIKALRERMRQCGAR